MHLDSEVPNQEISAGLGADLRSVARQCKLLIFITLKWGRGGEREIHSFHQAWQAVEEGEQAAGYTWLPGVGQVVILNYFLLCCTKPSADFMDTQALKQAGGI